LGILNRGQGIKPSRESLAELRHQSAMLEQADRALGLRDRLLFDMVRKAVKANDGDRATMYANELSRVRNIKRIIGDSQLAIDCIMIRIENFMDLCAVVEEMKPISEVIKGVSSEVGEVMPRFSEILSQLREVTSEALIETRVDVDQPILEGVLSTTSAGGTEILGEASSVVEDSLRESFPEPPLVEAPAQLGDKHWVEMSDEVVALIGSAHARRRVEEVLS